MSDPQRIQLRRVRGWRLPDGAINVARPTRWGNPFDVRRFGRETALTLYRNLVQGVWNPTELAHLDRNQCRIAHDIARDWQRMWFGGHPMESMSLLRGHDLACWCPLALPCHADVLLELANPGGES